MKMNIKNVFLGYNKFVKNKNNHDHRLIYKLLLVPFKASVLKSDVSQQIDLRSGKLPGLDKTWENLSGKQESFSVTQNLNKPKLKKDELMVNSNNYCYNMMNKLSKILFNNNIKPDIFKDSKQLINRRTGRYIYKYVIYVGNSYHYPTTLVFAIFPIKSNFLLKSHKVVCTILGRKIPKITTVSNNRLFQLPSNRNDNIANFYSNSKSSKVRVYKPLMFDDIFDTNGIKKVYATKTLIKFKKRKLSLTKDNINVKFINKKGKPNDIKDSILQDSDLLDSMSTFTGNGHSTIQRVHRDNLTNVLSQLTNYVKKNGKLCPFKLKNIPCINKQGTELKVTSDSMPIFCSLLRNRIVRKLLTGKVDVPYYQK